MMLLWWALWMGQEAAALNERAQALAGEGRGSEAAALWKDAVRKAPLYFPANFNLGLYYSNRKEYGEAERYLGTAVRVEPKDFNARFLYGQALAALGKSEAAILQWRKGLELQPNHVKLLGILAVEYGKGAYYGEAAAVAKRALALRAGDLSQYLLAIRACQDAQDSDGAKLAEEAARKFPDSARALFEHAWYLQRAGQVEKSKELLERAMRLDANYEEPYYFHGGLLLEEGKLQEAIPLLRKAVEIRPDYISAAVALGRALMEAEEFAEAERSLEAAARRAPDHPQPQLMLSRLYFRMGEAEKARAAKELSLRLRREKQGLMEKPQGRAFPAK